MRNSKNFQNMILNSNIFALVEVTLRWPISNWDFAEKFPQFSEIF